MGSRRSVLLVDLNSWAGHHGPYFKRFCRLFLEAGVRVEALCTVPDACTAYLRDLPVDPSRWHVHPYVPSSPHPTWREHLLCAINRAAGRLHWEAPWESEFALKNHRRCRAAQRRRVFGRRSPVFFADLGCMLSAGWPAIMRRVFPGQWAGLHITPCERAWPLLDEGERQTRRSAERAFGLPGCGGVCLLDEGIVPAYRQRFPRTAMVALPEFGDAREAGGPADERVWAAGVRDFARGRRLLGIIGELSERRNFLRFLEVAERIDGTRCGVVIAGKVPYESYDAAAAQRIRAFLANPPGHIYARTGSLLSDTAVTRVLEQLSVCYLCYRDFPYSSNFLAWAACAGCPVVVSDGYLMAQRVRAHGLGFVVGQDDVAQQAHVAEHGAAREALAESLAAYAGRMSGDAIREVFHAHVLPALGMKP